MGVSNSNIDLTNVDNEDLDELAKRIEGFYRSDTTVKSTLSYHWERNHLMLDGKQWLVYDTTRNSQGQWRSLSVSRANEYIPRPVTNLLFDVYQTLKAYLVQHRPQSSIRPNTQTYGDKMAAKLGNIVLDANFERLKEMENYEYAASCALTYGTVFKKDYWDTSSLQTSKIPRTEQRPQIDPNTGQQVGMQEVDAIDPLSGEPLFDEIPLGDVNTCVVEPYRIALDPLANGMHNARWIMEYAIQPLDWIRETYGGEDPSAMSGLDAQGGQGPALKQGYTGRVDEVKEEKTLSNSLQRFYQLKTSSGVSTGGNIRGLSQSSDEMIEDAAVVKEYYEAPSKKYPKGRMVVVANGVPLYAGDSPYSGPELGDWHPYSEFRWEIVPGRFWGKSPLDDATELQKHINSIDSTIILVRKTQAIPQKLIPIGSGIKKGEWTGRPGQEIYFREGGGTPTTIEATNVGQQVFAERELKKAEIKEITGAIDILKGDRPPGVTAASALEMLYEVGTGKLRPALDRWRRFNESSSKKQLRLVGQKYREPREQFIKLLHMKNKELPKEAIESFIGSDLYDNFNVIIEAGSNIPKLQSAEKANLIQLAQIGTLGLDNPENRLEFNKRMGIIGFDQDVSPDVTRAEWENDLLDNIMQGHNAMPVVLDCDEHQRHIDIHNRRKKRPDYITLASEVQQAYDQHCSEHEQFLQQQKQAAQEEALVTGQPPQMPGQEENAPPVGKGKGISEDTQKSILPGLGRGID